MIVLGAPALVDVVLAQPAKDWVLDQLSDDAVCAPAHRLRGSHGTLSRSGT